jgi:hypothetical protein
VGGAPVTAANSQGNVRTEPGDKIELLPPFSAPPAAIIWVMPNAIVRELGAWGEEYEIASGEDVDLAFKAWVNDLDVVYDQRVLVQHVGHGTSSCLDDQPGLWARNRRLFLEKWKGDDQVRGWHRAIPSALRATAKRPPAVAGGWSVTSPCAIAKIVGCDASSRSRSVRRHVRMGARAGAGPAALPPVAVASAPRPPRGMALRRSRLSPLPSQLRADPSYGALVGDRNVTGRTAISCSRRSCDDREGNVPSTERRSA